nr:LysM peptidoglycan-binding domain-containing protein [uncultured Flavobacterium sp.]
MRKMVILAAALLMLGSVTYGQAKYVEHKVSKGDTVSSISRKYNVSPSEIYRLNPDAVTGINVDAVLKVPSTSQAANVATNIAATKHVVAPKETLFSISQKYGIKPADIEALNKEVLKEGLKAGSTILIPNGKATKTVVTPPSSVVSATKPEGKVLNLYHTVEPKETKFGIAKRYGISVAELEKLNPEIKENLEKGAVVRLNAQTPVYTPGAKITDAPAKIVSNEDYVIQPKETLFSLSKMSGMSQENFLKLNPELKDGVKIGMTIKMPSTADNYKISVSKPQVDLSKKLTKAQTKNLVMLLPFNADKVGTNKDVTIQDQLKKDKFLNMTLDFYAGALVAIDSAKKMGLPLKVHILDSKETKTSSNVVGLVNNGTFNKADAIVGPFFQNHVETLAGMLESNGIPVVSPLSNEKGKPISNLYQAMPSAEDVKKKMVDYMFANNGNIIAVVDAKKGSVRRYLTESFPTIKIAALNDSGMPSPDALKAMLDKNRTNYIVLETESTGMVLNTCRTLLNYYAEYPIQLVTLDKNETLEFEEVPLDYLVKLKLLYPSVTRENDTQEATIFAKNFKKYNNIMPGKFATRGFDVTFDTILRLFNQDGYKASVEEVSSEQIENKFNYISIDGAYYNKGVYLMYYDEDLSIKEVN